MFGRRVAKPCLQCSGAPGTAGGPRPGTEPLGARLTRRSPSTYQHGNTASAFDPCQVRALGGNQRWQGAAIWAANTLSVCCESCCDRCYTRSRQAAVAAAAQQGCTRGPCACIQRIGASVRAATVTRRADALLPQHAGALNSGLLVERVSLPLPRHRISWRSCAQTTLAPSVPQKACNA